MALFVAVTQISPVSAEKLRETAKYGGMMITLSILLPVSYLVLDTEFHLSGLPCSLCKIGRAVEKR